ncbi:MAG: HEAT repeat domain-containing protein [Acidobacteriota bacterium]
MTSVLAPSLLDQGDAHSPEEDPAECTRPPTSMADELDNRPLAFSNGIGWIEERRRTDSLFRLLDHQEAAVRHASVTALVSLNPPDLTERARLMMHDPNPRVRESAAGIAGHLGYSDCSRRLLELCNDPSESVRCAAVEGLAGASEPQARHMLIHALRCDTPQAREAAARALGKADPATAIEPLIEALDDPEPWVRYHAARSLGNHAAPAAIERLALAVQSDPAKPVRAAAIEAVGQIGGDRAAHILAPLVRSDDAELARAALHALARLDHPDALPSIQWALHASDPEIRANAAQALADRGGPGVAEALEWMAATDTDPWAVLSTINALGTMKTPAAIAALISLSAEPAHREACVQALDVVGEEQIEEVAKGLLQHEGEVQRAAREALGRITHPKASALIADAAGRNDARPPAAEVDVVGRGA